MLEFVVCPKCTSTYPIIKDNGELEKIIKCKCNSVIRFTNIGYIVFDDGMDLLDCVVLKIKESEAMR